MFRHCSRPAVDRTRQGVGRRGLWGRGEGCATPARRLSDWAGLGRAARTARHSYRPLTDGHRAVGICRRSIMLASGRYAMLDDGMGFSLVPWKPVIEQRLEQQLAATVRGGGISWEIGRQRKLSLP